jgi:undecaprenyl pyrophosphate phosphatase UppP
LAIINFKKKINFKNRLLRLAIIKNRDENNNKMKRKRFFLRIIIGIVAACFLALLAFTFEENYREFIRNLYQQLTE